MTECSVLWTLQGSLTSGLRAQGLYDNLQARLPCPLPSSCLQIPLIQAPLVSPHLALPGL